MEAWRGHSPRPVTKEGEHPYKTYCPPGKMCFRSKLVDTVQKMWSPFRKLFATPDFTSWLRACFPSARSKEGQRGRRCLFIIRVGAGKFSGCEGFSPDFPKLARKVFVQLLSLNFLPQRSWRPLVGVTSKKRSFCVFMQTLGAIFCGQTRLGDIFTRIFRAFAQIFS